MLRVPWCFPGARACKLSSYAESHQGGAPLTIYDSSNTSLPMAVFSPLNYPKAHHMAHDTKTAGGFFGAGIKSTVTEIPAGWSQLFVLSAGVGINDGMMNWGDRMLKFTGKTRPDRYLDDTHSTIGFWTDNGGYYHYATGDKKWGSTYEEVLPKVKHTTTQSECRSATGNSIMVLPERRRRQPRWRWRRRGDWTAMTGPNSGGNKVFPSGWQLSSRHSRHAARPEYHADGDA